MRNLPSSKQISRKHSPLNSKYYEVPHNNHSNNHMTTLDNSELSMINSYLKNKHRGVENNNPNIMRPIDGKFHNTRANS